MLRIKIYIKEVLLIKITAQIQKEKINLHLNKKLWKWNKKNKNKILSKKIILIGPIIKLIKNIFFVYPELKTLSTKKNKDRIKILLKLNQEENLQKNQKIKNRSLKNQAFLKLNLY